MFLHYSWKRQLQHLLLLSSGWKRAALESKTSYLDFFLNLISQERRRAFFFFLSLFKKEIRPAKNLPVDECTVTLMPSPVLAFCPFSPLPSIYIILGHLSWRNYWLKDANCLRSCISSWSCFQVARYVKSIHFCTAVQLYTDTWSFQLSPFFFFLPCPPVLLSGHLVKSCLHRLTAIEVLEKKPDPCTYTLTNRIKMSRHKWNISLCFPVRFC